jgi:hypothetical protein
MMRRLACLSLLCFVVASPFSSALAQGTRLWTESTFQQLEQGTPHGVAIASDGRLLPGPASKLVYTSPSTYVWSVAADKQGNAYLATGSPASVIKVTPAGKATTLFKTKDLNVQAVTVGPHGSVYAATMPSGKVYKLNPDTANATDATAQVVFDPAQTKEKSKYIWALKFGPGGDLYIATGEPAAIYRVAPGGKPTLFYKSDEVHIDSLAFAPNGDLIAASVGSGLVYRISKAGKAFVLFDAPNKEITSVAVAPDGTIYAAGVGEKGQNTLPPLPVSNASTATVTATITVVAIGSTQSATTNTLIPNGSQIYAISPSGVPRILWSNTAEVVYNLLWTQNGLLASTGNNGHIYRIHPNGDYEDIAHLEASQATSFADTPSGIYVGTANTGKLYQLSHGQAPQSTYVSPVFDAGVFTQWGRAEVQTDTPADIQMFARSGNIENPARGWSDWHPVTINQGQLGTSSSRFVQWKLVLKPGASISSVGINFLPVNIAPVVDNIVVVPGVRASKPADDSTANAVTINFQSAQNDSVDLSQQAAASTVTGVKDKSAVAVRWAAHDDNGDKLVYSLYYRGQHENNWLLLRKGLHHTWTTFSADLLPDGVYRIKVVASDQPSHSPGKGLTGSLVSNSFTIDTTPPAISQMMAHIESGKLHVSFTATDPMSPIARAQFSVDAGPWQYIAPTGRISDSLTEHYDFTTPLPNSQRQPSAEVPDPSQHVITVRVFDRYHNVVLAKSVVQ